MQHSKNYMAMSKRDAVTKDDAMRKKDAMCADVTKEGNGMKKNDSMKKPEGHGQPTTCASIGYRPSIFSPDVASIGSTANEHVGRRHGHQRQKP